MLRVSRATLAAILLVAGLAAAASLAAEAPGDGGRALDGLQFSGQTGEQGKADHHKDVIMFSEGRFRSLDCENWGFGSAPYAVTKKGDTYHFTATLLSPDRGELAWKGTVVGDRATATFRWTHERWFWTIERDYWFEGTRTSAPARSVR